MAVTQEPILSRLDRLDNLMRHLEEMKIRSNRGRSSSLTPSTPSSGTGTPTSEGRASFLDFSHRSRDQSKHPCRPIDDVIVETEHKGTLLDRVERMEDRLFTLEEEMESEKQELRGDDKTPHGHNHKKKKGLKQFVKSCVRGKDKGNPGNKLHC